MRHEARMMLLFASAENPLWEILISNEITENKIANYLGIVRMTLTNWKKTESIGKKHKELFETVRHHIRDATKPGYSHPSRAPLSEADAEQAAKKVDEFYHLYISRRHDHIYEAAKLLGIGVRDCQKIIDYSQYSQRPLFPQMYYLDKNECDTHFALYAGLYHVWVKRYRATATFWFRCPMEVRYILRIKGGYVIRCKLNFPKLERRGRNDYWEYDGFIAIRDVSTFWTFERRKDIISSDYFHFITDLGVSYGNSEQECEALTMSGCYLTTDQDGPRTITTGEILLQKLSADRNDQDQVAKIMHGDSAVLDQTVHCAELNHFLSEFESFKESGRMRRSRFLGEESRA